MSESDEKKQPQARQAITSVCVFCGSSKGKNPAYVENAQALGAELAKQSITLVYGGGNIGLMGAVATACDAANGQVVGIIPHALAPREVSGDHESLGEQIFVKDMHTRKAMMQEKSGAFIAMPGGFGTLEELLEIMTWQQLGIHSKPIGLLNINGYFNGLIELFAHMIESGFVHEKWSDLLVVEADPKTLLDRLLVHEPPMSTINWITPEES